MNLPLNIDWQQILLHLLNFALLTGGLYFLLYKPVKSFMDKRTELYRSMDEEAKNKITKAQQTQADYEKRLQDAEEEIGRKKIEALSEAAKSGSVEIEKAKAEAGKIIAEARKTAQREHDKILSDAQGEVASLAAKATEKLLGEKSESLLYDQFLTSAERREKYE